MTLDTLGRLYGEAETLPDLTSLSKVFTTLSYESSTTWIRKAKEFSGLPVSGTARGWK